jgi:poly(beta-D-mannuronate) lyase
MNGIPHSPLAGYFQVKRALVAFNTFVNPDSSILIGRVGGSPKGGILPPEDCVFANNIIAGGKAPLIKVDTRPKNMIWRGNIAYGAPLGMEPAAGIRLSDPRLVQAADGLLRPAQDSVVRGAAEGDYPFVIDDIDGQARRAKKDIGCDQFSTAPITRRPLGPKDVGPQSAARG